MWRCRQSVRERDHHHAAAESRGRGGMSSIRALGAGRNVGVVTRFWVPHGVAMRQRFHGRVTAAGMNAEQPRWQLSQSAWNAPAASSSIVGGRDNLAAGLMLVLMVAEVLLGRDTCFVRAVRRRRAPDQLERHDEQQEREQPTTHDSDSRLAGAAPARSAGRANRDVVRFSIGCCSVAGARDRGWALSDSPDPVYSGSDQPMGRTEFKAAWRGPSRCRTRLVRTATPGPGALQRRDARQPPSVHPTDWRLASGRRNVRAHRAVWRRSSVCRSVAHLPTQALRAHKCRASRGPAVEQRISWVG
jgi:hypothetical protein